MVDRTRAPTKPDDDQKLISLGVKKMLAKEIKEKYVRAEERPNVGVIAIGKGYWYHVHDDEPIPENETIAIHPRNLLKRDQDSIPKIPDIAK